MDLPSTRVASGAVNPVGKLTSNIADMACGAECIDDIDVLPAGGTPRVFGELYAPSTLRIFLREFTFGHANQLAAVARALLVARTLPLPGIEQRAFLDIDSLLRTVYGHNKQGASFGHAKIANRELLRHLVSHHPRSAVPYASWNTREIPSCPAGQELSPLHTPRCTKNPGWGRWIATFGMWPWPHSMYRPCSEPFS